MARNGSGTYNLPNPALQTGETSDVTDYNGTMNDIATALTGSLAADGQTPVTGAVDFDNNGIIDLGATNVTGNLTLSAFTRLDAPTELTIAAGVITATKSYHLVDTQSDDPTDDLDTISGGLEGAILILRAANSNRTIVLKDGTGNLNLAGDFSLDHTKDTITLLFDNTLSQWLEISRSDTT